MEFSSIPVRGNGETFVSGWVNSLRTAGIDLAAKVNTYLGGGASTSEQSFAIADNQTAANITGLVASPLYRVTKVKYWVKRIATDTVMESGTFTIIYTGTNFYLGDRRYMETPITCGMEFDVHLTTGQVTYTSSDMAGSYDTVNSKMGYSVMTEGTI